MLSTVASEGLSATKFIQSVDGMPSEMDLIDDDFEEKEKKKEKEDEKFNDPAKIRREDFLNIY